MEEDNQKTTVINNFEEGSNCQVFNGPVSGSIFAMPGSTVNQYAGQPPKDSNIANDDRRQRVEDLLRKEIEAAKAAEKSSKLILLPYKAAIEAGAISDTLTCDEFNSKYKCSVSKSSFTEWIRGGKNKDVYYSHYEIDPLIAQFRTILNP